jgi:hypothetical protein
MGDDCLPHCAMSDDMFWSVVGGESTDPYRTVTGTNRFLGFRLL